MDQGSPGSGLSASRRRVAAWVEAPRIRYSIVTLIVINAVTLGMETSPTVMSHIGTWLIALDRFILGVFVVEIAAKLYAWRGRFFRDPWNVFDFLIVGIALVPASGPLAVMRVLRILRVLRLVSVMPKLRFVVESLLSALPGIASIAGLLLLLYYVFAVMATGLFGPAFDEWFGSIGRSMYTLFQIMTLESWSMGIVRPVMESYPWAWLFFIPFILLATFTMLNLFIAIIVNTMQTMHDATHEQDKADLDGALQEEEDRLEMQLQAMHGELEEIRRLLRERESTES